MRTERPTAPPLSTVHPRVRFIVPALQGDQAPTCHTTGRHPVAEQAWDVAGMLLAGHTVL